MASTPILWLVIPCYNEAGTNGPLSQVASVFLDEVKQHIANGQISGQSKVLFVDDGSTDDTWDVIQAFAKSDPSCAGIRLSRNRGHQNALLAGLMEARGKSDIVITMDCDGQDDPRAIDEMLKAYEQGFDVVYGVRGNRSTDGFFKRLSAESFYKLLDTMGVEVVFNHADYRLLSKQALDGLSEFGESNLFLRGMVPLVGFPSTTVEYDRQERVSGKSHYSLRKMFALAIDGITSLSIKPIRLVSGLGITFSILGLIGVIWALVTVFMGNAVAGWASTICAVCFIGGLQLLCLGVIGEYVGKIYLETKQRPRYIVRDRVGLSQADGHQGPDQLS